MFTLIRFKEEDKGEAGRRNDSALTSSECIERGESRRTRTRTPKLFSWVFRKDCVLQLVYFIVHGLSSCICVKLSSVLLRCFYCRRVQRFCGACEPLGKSSRRIYRKVKGGDFWRRLFASCSRSQKLCSTLIIQRLQRAIWRPQMKRNDCLSTDTKTRTNPSLNPSKASWSASSAIRDV